MERECQPQRLKTKLVCQRLFPLLFEGQHLLFGQVSVVFAAYCAEVAVMPGVADLYQNKCIIANQPAS